jgi:uncharacterized protein YjbJ (UPF0337 family)
MSTTTTTTGPSKTSGKWHSIKGSFKQGVCIPHLVVAPELTDPYPQVGDAFRIRSLSRSGANEHAAGQTELGAGKIVGHAEGTKERVLGKKDQVVGAATGDFSQEQAGTFSDAKMLFQKSLSIAQVMCAVQRARSASGGIAKHELFADRWVFRIT